MVEGRGGGGRKGRQEGEGEVRCERQPGLVGKGRKKGRGRRGAPAGAGVIVDIQRGKYAISRAHKFSQSDEPPRAKTWPPRFPTAPRPPLHPVAHVAAALLMRGHSCTGRSTLRACT